MTRDDIIKLAKEAGLPTAWISESGVLRWEALTRFAALVAAAEREECAKVCDAVTWSDEGRYFAKAIRARGE